MDIQCFHWISDGKCLFWWGEIYFLELLCFQESFPFIHNNCIQQLVKEDYVVLFCGWTVTAGQSYSWPPAPCFLCVFPGVSFRVISLFDCTHHVGTPSLYPHWPCPSQVPANQQKHGWEKHTVWVRAPGLSESPTRWDTCCVSCVHIQNRETYICMRTILLKCT